MIMLSITLLTSFLLSSLVPLSHSSPLTHRQSSTCPPIWSTIASDLQTTFRADSTCTDSARAAIRLSFHDCFPAACDGSIILANECTDRGENAQMTAICGTLGAKASSYKVSTADLIQFATAIGAASCTGGPILSFKVGRNDSSTANPAGQMPGPNTAAATMVATFAAKGFSVTELVALTGAHTIGKDFRGNALDTTVGKWDSSFYTETANGSVQATIPSDGFLSSASESSQEWASVGASDQSFSTAFVAAMEKMSLMGNDVASMVDCSNVVSQYASAL